MRGKPARAYRSKDAMDAWHRTVAMLKEHQPLP